MRTPAPRELLDAWDAGWALSPAERLQPLLHAAAEQADPGALSLGERDRLLVVLRERLFGTTLRARTNCPDCGEVLELTLATSDLLEADTPPEEIVVRSGGLAVRCRPLRPSDLADAAVTESAEAARMLLVSRAVLAVEEEGRPALGDTTDPAKELPAGIVAVVAAALAEADPLADVELPVRCEACGAQWKSPFDIVSYLWQEIDSWANRLLAEVHTLARAYGWSEQDVLALSPHRRRRYLELVADG
jgi:hypothetical protein